MPERRIRFHCNNCHNRLKADPGEGGRVFQCPFCRSAQIVPVGVIPTTRDEAEENARKQLEQEGNLGRILPSTEKATPTTSQVGPLASLGGNSSDYDLRIRFLCSECQGRLRARPEKAGKLVRCPFCKTMMIVPAGIAPTPGSDSAAPRPPRSAPEPAMPGTRPISPKEKTTGAVSALPPTREIEIQPQAKEERKPAVLGQVSMETSKMEAASIADKVCSIEKYFQVLDRCVDRLERECLRVLGNEKLNREQKERFVRLQLQANYEEVVRFQEFVQKSLEKKKQEIARLGSQATARMGRELKELQKEEENISLLVMLVFGEDGNIRKGPSGNTTKMLAVSPPQDSSLDLKRI